jgi:hypothetical protein
MDRAIPPEGGSPFYFSLKMAKIVDRFRTRLGQYTGRIRTGLGHTWKSPFWTVSTAYNLYCVQ